jgi:hypothetical protein
MITLFLQGQKLTLAQTVVAADSVAYLTARLIYKTSDWTADGLSVWAHFKNGETQIDAEAVDGEIGTDAGVNLTAGEWSVWVTGHVYDGAELVRRITSTVETLTVKESGVDDGEPLPTRSFGETILGEVRDIYNAVGNMIHGAEDDVAAQLEAQNAAVSEQLRTQNAAVDEQLRQNVSDVSTLLSENEADVDARLDENESAVARMLGAVKNRRDDSFIQLWAGTEEQFAAAEKSADTIYLVDLLGGDGA